uniref:Uncharacterized protein n=1 Tax=Amphimedon queenslandica TaxID=400682 RepID=A0A1X7UJS5_AMPQE
MEFEETFENIYGTYVVTLNIHLRHIMECIIDYAFVYGFCLFGFHYFNEMLGNYDDIGGRLYI